MNNLSKLRKFYSIVLSLLVLLSLPAVLANYSADYSNYQKKESFVTKTEKVANFQANNGSLPEDKGNKLYIYEDVSDHVVVAGENILPTQNSLGDLIVNSPYNKTLLKGDTTLIQAGLTGESLARGAKDVGLAIYGFLGDFADSLYNITCETVKIPFKNIVIGANWRNHDPVGSFVCNQRELSTFFNVFIPVGLIMVFSTVLLKRFGLTTKTSGKGFGLTMVGATGRAVSLVVKKIFVRLAPILSTPQGFTAAAAAGGAAFSFFDCQFFNENVTTAEKASCALTDIGVPILSALAAGLVVLGFKGAVGRGQVLSEKGFKAAYFDSYKTIPKLFSWSIGTLSTPASKVAGVLTWVGNRSVFGYNLVDLTISTAMGYNFWSRHGEKSSIFVNFSNTASNSGQVLYFQDSQDSERGSNMVSFPCMRKISEDEFNGKLDYFPNTLEFEVDKENKTTDKLLGFLDMYCGGYGLSFFDMTQDWVGKYFISQPYLVFLPKKETEQSMLAIVYGNNYYKIRVDRNPENNSNFDFFVSKGTDAGDELNCKIENYKLTNNAYGERLESKECGLSFKVRTTKPVKTPTVIAPTFFEPLDEFFSLAINTIRERFFSDFEKKPAFILSDFLLLEPERIDQVQQELLEKSEEMNLLDAQRIIEKTNYSFQLFDVSYLLEAMPLGIKSFAISSIIQLGGEQPDKVVIYDSQNNNKVIAIISPTDFSRTQSVKILKPKRTSVELQGLIEGGGVKPVITLDELNQYNLSDLKEGKLNDSVELVDITKYGLSNNKNLLEALTGLIEHHVSLYSIDALKYALFKPFGTGDDPQVIAGVDGAESIVVAQLNQDPLSEETPLLSAVIVNLDGQLGEMISNNAIEHFSLDTAETVKSALLTPGLTGICTDKETGINAYESYGFDMIMLDDSFSKIEPMTAKFVGEAAPRSNSCSVKFCDRAQATVSLYKSFAETKKAIEKVLSEMPSNLKSYLKPENLKNSDELYKIAYEQMLFEDTVNGTQAFFYTPNAWNFDFYNISDRVGEPKDTELKNALNENLSKKEILNIPWTQGTELNNYLNWLNESVLKDKNALKKETAGILVRFLPDLDRKIPEFISNIKGVKKLGKSYYTQKLGDSYYTNLTDSYYTTLANYIDIRQNPSEMLRQSDISVGNLEKLKNVEFLIAIKNALIGKTIHSSAIKSFLNDEGLLSTEEAGIKEKIFGLLPSAIFLKKDNWNSSAFKSDFMTAYNEEINNYLSSTFSGTNFEDLVNSNPMFNVENWKESFSGTDASSVEPGLYGVTPTFDLSVSNDKVNSLSNLKLSFKERYLLQSYEGFSGKLNISKNPLLWHSFDSRLPGGDYGSSVSITNINTPSITLKNGESPVLLEPKTNGLLRTVIQDFSKKPGKMVDGSIVDFTDLGDGIGINYYDSVPVLLRVLPKQKQTTNVFYYGVSFGDGSVTLSNSEEYGSETGSTLLKWASPQQLLVEDSLKSYTDTQTCENWNTEQYYAKTTIPSTDPLYSIAFMPSQSNLTFACSGQNLDVEVKYLSGEISPTKSIKGGVFSPTPLFTGAYSSSGQTAKSINGFLELLFNNNLACVKETETGISVKWNPEIFLPKKKID